jgi:hypothetical protein
MPLPTLRIRPILVAIRKGIPMKNLSVILLTLLFCVAGQAKADLMIEPYLGYQMEKADLTSGGADLGGKTNAVNIGGRLGYRMPLLHFWFAGDLDLIASGKFKGNSVSNGDLSGTHIYADVGYDFPVLLRIWMGYGLSNATKAEYDGGGGSLELSDGTNLKFGVGFTPLPLISLNIEYLTHDYAKYKTGTTSGKTADVYDAHKETGIMLSVSLPLAL